MARLIISQRRARTPEPRTTEWVSGPSGRTREIRAVTPTSIPDPYLHAVGYVIHQWSIVDLVMERMLVNVSEVSATAGRVIFGRIDGAQKADLLTVLLGTSLVSGPLKNMALKFAKDAGLLASHRNAIAHGGWIEVQGERGTLLHCSLSRNPEKRLSPHAKLQSADDIIAIGDKIRAAVMGGNVVLSALLGEPSPSHDKSASKPPLPSPTHDQKTRAGSKPRPT